MNVLIVDDDAVSCEILGETLTEIGFTPHCASNGLEAIDAMNAGAFSLVVCDWEMPEMDGPQFCQWLRASIFAESTYVIMLTSRDGIEHTAEGIASGADTFLSKPCDPTIIGDHLRLGVQLLAPGATSDTAGR